MEIDDLIENEYYFLESDDHHAYICKSGGGWKCGKYIYLNEKKYRYDYITSSSTWSDNCEWKIRSATRREIKHIKDCMKANIYVEPKESYLSYFLGF